MISGDLPANWYNYTLATAGTIVDKNTSSENPVTNTNPATESVCPKGWALPSQAQIRSIGNNSGMYISNFSPVLGGVYGNGALQNEAAGARWWGSEKYDNAIRYTLGYDGNNLNINWNRRYFGYYIRCVQAP